MSGPAAARTRDGRRLHLQHGPIDLIIEADGDASAIDAGYRAAWNRFATVLDELVAELPRLRRRLDDRHPLSGSVALRMAVAVAPFHDEGLTPMAAVAGSVADEIRDVIVDAGRGHLTRVFVNNGGDIALALTAGTSYDVGLVPVPQRPALAGKATIRAADPVRGVATSGRHGRSLSLGIADAVTVLAANAAAADAAATVIANAVDLPGHGAIRRVDAAEVDPDTDLAGQLVTVGVDRLTEAEVDQAIAAGIDEAARQRRRGLVTAAVVCLDGVVGTVGSPSGSSALDGVERTAEHE